MDEEEMDWRGQLLAMVTRWAECTGTSTVPLVFLAEYGGAAAAGHPGLQTTRHRSLIAREESARRRCQRHRSRRPLFRCHTKADEDSHRSQLADRRSIANLEGTAARPVQECMLLGPPRLVADRCRCFKRHHRALGMLRDRTKGPCLFCSIISVSVVLAAVVLKF